MTNTTYINTRVIRGFDGEFLVQGQSEITYNWETIRRVPLDDQLAAEAMAGYEALKISRKRSGLILAYNTAGIAIIGFIDGNHKPGVWLDAVAPAAGR